MNRPVHRHDRGVATLVVVMILFFVVSLVAAYTSRNLIFEMRTSTNQYRSTAALEAAEAGLEWGLAQLNDGRITATCQASTQPTDTSFRQRYLSFSTSPSTYGNITANSINLGGTPPSIQYLYPTCVQSVNSGVPSWSCSCPTNSAPALAAPTTPGVHPAFRLLFRAVSGQPGVVQIYSNGCTRLDTDYSNGVNGYGNGNGCQSFKPSITPPSASVGATNEGVAVVSVLASLTGSIASPPVNALTARGNISMASGGLTANFISPVVPIYPNGALPVSQYAVHAGGTVSPTVTATALAVPGSPPNASAILASDTTLSALSASQMFSNTFNMSSSTFLNQPALLMPCGPGAACNATTVRNAIALNPNRPVWVDGDFTVDSAGDIGSAAAPVLLIVNGNVDFGTAGINLYGVVYVMATDWASAGAAQVQGAVIAQGNIGGNSTATISYNAAVIKQLLATTGTFVRVPGSWQDFQ